jgi:Lon-like ATP-dependent protease
LLINAEYEYIQKDEVPGIRIYRSKDQEDPFDIYFCKTKYNAYKILMDLDKGEVENRMAQRSRKDLDSIRNMKGTSPDKKD